MAIYPGDYIRVPGVILLDMSNPKLSDKELVDSVKKDKNNFVHIIKIFEQPLLRYARYLTSDHDLAKDVVQQALIKAYINLNSYNPAKKLSSWLYRIVHNEAINMLKKTKHDQSFDDYLSLPTADNLQEDVIKTELINITRECLGQIPPIYRDVLSLYYLEDQKYEEISEILHIPISTVGVRLARAKKIMRNVCKTKIR